MAVQEREQNEQNGADKSVSIVTYCKYNTFVNIDTRLLCLNYKFFLSTSHFGKRDPIFTLRLW